MDITRPCRPFDGARQKNGYGSRWDSTRQQARGAHVMAWEEANGPVPTGLEVCHSCDNPACVEIMHLFVGTRRDNMQDMAAKGRGLYQRNPQVILRNEEHGRAVLTNVEVQQMREDYAKGRGSYAALAQQYGIAKSSAAAIITRKVRV